MDTFQWPKHIGGLYVIKLHAQNQTEFYWSLINCTHLINSWNVEHGTRHMEHELVYQADANEPIVIDRPVCHVGGV